MPIFGPDKEAEIDRRIAMAVRAHVQLFHHGPKPKPPTEATLDMMQGPIQLGFGESIDLSDRHIRASDPWRMPNGNWAGGECISCLPHAVVVKLRHCKLNAFRACLWLDCDTVDLDRVDAESAPSTAEMNDNRADDYVARGRVRVMWVSRSCKFKNKTKGLIRVYGCPDFRSFGDSFSGSRLMLGGGETNEWDNPLPFKGVLEDARIECSRIIVYARSEVTFTNCDFDSTPIMEVHGRVALERCKNPPEIKRDTSKGGVADVRITT